MKYNKQMQINLFNFCLFLMLLHLFLPSNELLALPDEKIQTRPREISILQKAENRILAMVWKDLPYHFKANISSEQLEWLIDDARAACNRNKCDFAIALRNDGIMSDATADKADALFQRAYNALNNNNYPESIALYTEAINTDRSLILALSYRAEAFRHLGQHEQAANDLLEFIKSKPDNSELIYDICVSLLLELKRHDEAVTLLDSWIEKYGCSACRSDTEKRKSAHFYNLRGRVYSLQGQHQKVIEDVSMAIKLNPQGYYIETLGEAYYAS
jgi:tetratricopeptide (TPR) repeat protein